MRRKQPQQQSTQQSQPQQVQHTYQVQTGTSPNDSTGLSASGVNDNNELPNPAGPALGGGNAGIGSPAFGSSSGRGMSFPGAGAPPILGMEVDARLRDSKGKKGGFKDWKRRSVTECDKCSCGVKKAAISQRIASERRK